MAITDIIPWNRGREVATRRDNDVHPFLALHREMNRMFDEVFRGFDPMQNEPLWAFGGLSWPRIDIDESDKEIRIIAELPGLNEEDVRLEIANDVLSISGEKKFETSDKDRRFSELYYGRIQRRIALGDVDGDKASARFKDGVLTITVPKSQRARENVRRIAINGRS
jgi:HSP20 family protein